MALRVFKCPHCEHKARLGAMQCSACGRPITALNWSITILAILLACIVIAIYLIAR